MYTQLQAPSMKSLQTLILAPNKIHHSHSPLIKNAIMNASMGWALTLAACTTDPDKDETTSPSLSTESADSATIAPYEGDWEMHNLQTMREDCGLDNIEQLIADIVGQSIVNLSMETEDQFVLTMETGEPISCSLQGQNYQCDANLQQEDLNNSELQINATLNIRSIWQGQFVETTEATTTAELDVECAGNGCSSLQLIGIQFPCDVLLRAELFALQ